MRSFRTSRFLTCPRCVKKFDYGCGESPLPLPEFNENYQPCLSSQLRNSPFGAVKRLQMGTPYSDAFFMSSVVFRGLTCHVGLF